MPRTKKTVEEFRDEKDVVSALDAAQEENTSLRTMLGDAPDLRTKLAAMTAERDELLRQASIPGSLEEARMTISRLTGERDTYMAQVTTLTTERDALKVSQRDFDSELTEKLTRFGIRKEAVTLPTGPEAVDESKMTLTQRCQMKNAAKKAQEVA